MFSLKSLNLGYIRRLIGYAFKHNSLFYLAISLSVVSVILELVAMSVLFPLSQLATGQTLGSDFIVRSINFVGLNPSIRIFLLVFISLFFFRILMMLAGDGLIAYLGKKVQSQLSSEAFKNIMTVFEIQEIEKKSIGYFISLAGDETARAGGLIVILSKFVNLLILSFLYYFAILIYSPTIALVVVLFLILSFLASINILKTIGKLGIRMVDESQANSSMFLDSLNGFRSVKAFSAEPYVIEKYETSIFQYVGRTQFLIDLLNLLGRLLPLIVLLFVFGCFIYFNGAGNNNADYAFAATLLVFLMRLLPTIGECANVFMKIISDAKAGKDVLEVIEAGYHHKAQSTSGKDLNEAVRKIEICNIHYSYNKIDDVLRNFNYVLECGNSYALVGQSGVGKSTLMDLLLRFHLLDSGKIMINGTSMSEISLQSLRKKILLLGQETIIFNDTVFKNICFGLDHNLDSIRRASQLSEIEETIETLPQKYETILQYRGSNLSGGQRQRIGLARALLRQPEVLILDESTSALDQNTRDRVVSNILQEYQERIVIFVTHDTSITRKVDHIIEIKRDELDIV